MLQWIGGALLFGSACCLGWHYAGIEEGRVRQTEGFLLLVRHIRTRIVCFCDPIERIYADFQNPALEACGFLPAMRAGGLADALQACKDRLYIGEEEMRTLAAFGAELGKSDTTAQAAVCDYTMKEIEAVLHRRKEEAPRRARAARSLGVCGGLARVILLF